MKKPRTMKCAAEIRTRRLRPSYFLAVFSILPAPPHFVQLLPALAASTQHACEQVLPASFAFTQQPATLAASPEAANIIPTENTEAAARAASDFESFFIIVLGVVDLVRAAGVEPASHAWEAHILPMYYARPVGQNTKTFVAPDAVAQVQL